MKNKLTLSDTCRITSGEAFSSEDTMPLKGEVKLTIDGEVFEFHNRINQSFLFYLAQCMEFPSNNQYIRSAELFTEANKLPYESQSGKDGIVFLSGYSEETAVYKTMITNTMTPVHTYGRRWAAGATVEEEQDASPSPSGSPSPSPSQLLLLGIELGRHYTTLASQAFYFLTAYRNMESETLEDPIDQLLFPYNIQHGSEIEVEWEIYFDDTPISP